MVRLDVRSARHAGFTQFELAIILAVVGMLAALEVPRFLESVERAKASEAFAYLSAVRSAQERYLALHGEYSPDLSQTRPPRSSAAILHSQSPGARRNGADEQLMVAHVDPSQPGPLWPVHSRLHRRGFRPGKVGNPEAAGHQPVHHDRRQSLMPQRLTRLIQASSRLLADIHHRPPAGQPLLRLVGEGPDVPAGRVIPGAVPLVDHVKLESGHGGGVEPIDLVLALLERNNPGVITEIDEAGNERVVSRDPAGEAGEEEAISGCMNGLISRGRPSSQH